MDNPARRQRRDEGQSETEVTRSLNRGDQDGRWPFGKTWKVFCAVYLPTVLIVGISLEAVWLSTRGCPLGFSALYVKGRGVLLVNSHELPVQLYSIACMTLTMVLVAVDLVMSQCFRSRRQFDQESTVTSVGIDISNLNTGSLLEPIIIHVIAPLGIVTVPCFVYQYRKAFAECWRWTTECGEQCTRHDYDWTMITLRVYLVIKCVFLIVQVAYFVMLTTSNTALFSKSRFNMFMVHHVMATTLYLCIRTAVEMRTHMQDASSLYFTGCGENWRNTTGSLVYLCKDDHSLWATSDAWERVAVELYPLVIVLGLLFVACYLDVWNIYRQTMNMNNRWKLSSKNQAVSSSRSGFHQLLERFTEHLQDTAWLVRMIVYHLVVLGPAVLISFRLTSLQLVLMYHLVLVLLMIFLTVAGLVILRPNVAVERSIGSLGVLLLISLLGGLCDNFFCGLGLYYSSSTVRIVEQTLWMFQSVLQVSLILVAFQKEGRYANAYCGTTPLLHVIDTLITLNVGVVIYHFSPSYSVNSILSRNTIDLYVASSHLKSWTWIRTVTSPLALLFTILSYLFLLLIRRTHNRLISAINVQRSIKKRQ